MPDETITKPGPQGDDPKRPAVAFDHFDYLVVGGFASLIGGIWWLSPPFALIIGGALAGLFGLAGSWMKARKGVR